MLLQYSGQYNGLMSRQPQFEPGQEHTEVQLNRKSNQHNARKKSVRIRQPLRQGGKKYGQMPEWSKGEDLRSSSIALRGFEPHSVHLVGRFFSGVAQWLACRAHNPKVDGSTPSPARPQVTGRIGANYTMCWASSRWQT